ncbi:MAG TPA: DMT family transporter [Candidatus Limnocylindrales bacterium]|nr:DMT family transporter [Candidatus Limnocylindrales bacterium]
MADLLGGLGSRRAGLLATLVGMEAVGLVGAVAALALSREPAPPPIALAWALAAGTSGVLGLAALYQALAGGLMSVVSPIAAAIAAGLPAVIGTLLLDEPLSKWQAAGVVCAIAAVTVASLPSGAARLERGQLVLAVGAGLGFGLFFVAVDQAQEAGAGLWWLLGGVRGISTLLVVAAAGIAVALCRGRRPPRALIPLVVATGVTDLGGNVFTTLALPLAPLGVVAVLSSLYPIVTILLAVGLLGERVGRLQVGGVALAVLAILLFAA